MNGFGDWLRDRRTEAGLTQNELHKKSGVSASYISTLERNQPHSITGAQLRPEPDKVRLLAKALNQNIDEALKLAGYAPAGNVQEIVSINFDFDGLPEKEIEKVNYLKDLLESEVKKLEILKNTAVKNKTSSALDALDANPEFEKQKSRAKNDAAEVKK